MQLEQKWHCILIFQIPVQARKIIFEMLRDITSLYDDKISSTSRYEGRTLVNRWQLKLHPRFWGNSWRENPRFQGYKPTDDFNMWQPDDRAWQFPDFGNLIGTQWASSGKKITAGIFWAVFKPWGLSSSYYFQISLIDLKLIYIFGLWIKFNPLDIVTTGGVYLGDLNYDF